jgi:hypothetical protein
MRTRAALYLFPVIVLSLLWLSPPLMAAEKSSKETKLGDAREYVEAIDRARDLSVDEQIELWRRFLNDHPNSSFRDEIETNVKHLDDLLTQTDPTRKREQKDSDRYLRAVEYSKKLSNEDQSDLWEQFLEENPQTLYRKEILQRLEELHVKPERRTPLVGVKNEAVVTVKQSPVISRLPYKNAQKATLLATFPGLIVPGIAHWYTRDYAIAGILTGARVGGLAIGIPGIINQNRTLIIIGAVLAGFSYLVDIADAPFTVSRYNDELDRAAKTTSLMNPRIFGTTSWGEIAVSFHF